MYEKNKYLKVEFSHYELQIINRVLQRAKRENQDFFTEENLKDTKYQMGLSIEKLNPKK